MEKSKEEAVKGKRNILAAGLILALSASVWGCQSREKGAGEENVPEFVLTYAENQRTILLLRELTDLQNW